MKGCLWNLKEVVDNASEQEFLTCVRACVSVLDGDCRDGAMPVSCLILQVFGNGSCAQQQGDRKDKASAIWQEVVSRTTRKE